MRDGGGREKRLSETGSDRHTHTDSCNREDTPSPAGLLLDPRKWRGVGEGTDKLNDKLGPAGLGKAKGCPGEGGDVTRAALRD